MKSATSKLLIDNYLKACDSTVYVVTRHGRRRRFLSRSAAINNLVHFMVTGTFDKAGIPTHEPTQRVLHEGVYVNQRGSLTEGYWNAHHRTHRRVMKLLARQRDIALWEKKHAAWVAMRDELYSQKPY
ncbi:hypothetical protein [Pantoea stewartii]|uniref:Uncharacterized protein n=1 Tax=Pantoea stewartii subsp. stewartii DC283 TaxID=660596 RepID=H3R900_PANSE|nr:hypothetical protein [Pantoea stewartii]ARF51126.1 hypothetical protein DSJ_18595 [Pantoea stewartii subsp. stewartii DC283]EHU01663.1 hypothetical protein CKS_0097 [Pantoea stewartii subsp. stewartii DC283]KAB0555125.1 hypothetical protein F7Q90_09930 [Pantoea stewartii subsp. stewartii]